MVGVITGEGAPSSGRIARTGEFNFDDVGSVVRQQAGAKGRGSVAAQFQDSKAAQQVHCYQGSTGQVRGRVCPRLGSTTVASPAAV